MDMIAREWNKEVSGKSNVDIWQNKIRHLRQFLRGWAKNVSGIYKDEQDRLLQFIDALDRKAETCMLDEHERSSKNEAEQRVRVLLREEEMKWALRAKVRAIVQGDNNTIFFHLIANGKHRKKIITQLEQDEGTIIGHENLKVYISEYYRSLFGAPEENMIYLDETNVQDIPQLNEQENEVLSARFTEQEVYDAIVQMKHNKAPGPDGFPAEFYKKCWHVIKGDLMAMFHDLFNGRLQLFHLNFGTITLLPKKVDAMRIQQFRPICLLNVSFKIFTKTATNRLTKIADSVDRKSVV